MNRLASQSKAHPFSIILWILLLAWVARVTIFIRLRSGSSFSAVDATAAVQIIIVFLILILVFLSSRLPRVWSQTSGSSFQYLIYYYMFSAISAIWSTIPEYTFYRATEYLAMILGVLVALSLLKDFRKAEFIVLLIAFVVIIFTLIGHIRVVGFSLDWSRWHTNSFSVSAAMLLIYCLGEYLTADRKRKVRLLSFGTFGFFIVVLGTSTASNISTLFGLFMIAFLSRSLKLYLLTTLLTAIIVPIALLIEVKGSTITQQLFAGKSAEDVYKLEHRGDLWEYFFNIFLENPIVGHGFSVLSDSSGTSFVSHTHSSLFAILVGTGIIGFFIAFIYGLKLIRELIPPVLQHQIGAIGAATAILTALVNSLSMPMVFSLYEESSLVFLSFSALALLFVYIPHKKRGHK